MGDVGEDWAIRRKISMSERVGKTLTFMHETACVHVHERELIGYCKMYAEMYPEDTEFIQWLEEHVIKGLVNLGQSKWFRDQITDLGFALSGGEKAESTEDVKDILETEIE